MKREPLLEVHGAAAPLLRDDVDTDQIIPSAYLKDMNADMAQGLLAYMRRTPDGQVNHDFVLERPAFKAAPILIVGSNFGCGSSRETAVWSLQEAGIRCVIAAQLQRHLPRQCVPERVPTAEAPDGRHRANRRRAGAVQCVGNDHRSGKPAGSRSGLGTGRVRTGG